MVTKRDPGKKRISRIAAMDETRCGMTKPTGPWCRRVREKFNFLTHLPLTLFNRPLTRDFQYRLSQTERKFAGLVLGHEVPVLEHASRGNTSALTDVRVFRSRTDVEFTCTLDTFQFDVRGRLAGRIYINSRPHKFAIPLGIYECGTG